LPQYWKESVIVRIYKNGDTTGYSNFRGISLLPTTYKMLSNIIISRSTPYEDEIIGYHQCGYRRNRPSTDQIFDTNQIREECGSVMGQYLGRL